MQASLSLVQNKRRANHVGRQTTIHWCMKDSLSLVHNKRRTANVGKQAKSYFVQEGHQTSCEEEEDGHICRNVDNKEVTCAVSWIQKEYGI